jgi:hypothetical protein
LSNKTKSATVTEHKLFHQLNNPEVASQTSTTLVFRPGGAAGEQLFFTTTFIFWFFASNKNYGKAFAVL